MMKKSLLLSVVAVSLLLPSGLIIAADQQRDRDMDKSYDQNMNNQKDMDTDKVKSQDMNKNKVQKKAQKNVKTKDRIYGSQIMTQKERNEFRAKMRAGKTAEEREQIRMEHHESMKERAKTKGISLPDEPPAKGGHMAPGAGMGNGDGIGAGSGRKR